MEVRVDRDRCVVSGLCVLLVPAIFDQSDEDGKVLLTTATPGPELAGAVRAAASRCPSGAIRAFDEARENMTNEAGRGADARAHSRSDIRVLVERQWRAALNVSEISGGDDFFGLGGHSLAALTVMTAIEQALDIELDGMRDIWDHSTLDAFVARVCALAGA